MECEPGTLSAKKLGVMRKQGITRLSLGVENFDESILAINGRAHGTREIHQAWEWIQAQSFPGVNVDLIAGMLEETDENWRRCVGETVPHAPGERHGLPDGNPFQHDNFPAYEGGRQAHSTRG